jgi:uncharacterized protein YndB with AHSA1/START domain
MRTRFIILACLLAPAALASSQVTPAGFTIRQELAIAAPPEQVYRALLTEVGAWWDPAHTYSGDSRNLTIDARPGGCFCEALPKGGGVEHLRIASLMPPALVRMSGALGPLQAAGLAGSMTFSFVKADTATTLKFSYVVGGYREGGFEPIAPLVEKVLDTQLQRLKRYVETGKPEARP